MSDDDAALSDAFEEFFRETVAALRRYAVRAVGDAHADDIVSETFTIVWRKWADSPVPPRLRRAWTFKVAHNVVAHHVRSQLRRGQLLRRLSTVRLDDMVDPAVRLATDDQVVRDLALLPLGEREALALVVWADLTPQEAAFVLGCSTTAVHSRLTRARRRFVDASAPPSGTDRQTEEVGP